MSLDLAEIFNKWGTDKAQDFCGSVWHGYAGACECLFGRYRHQVRTVLEIGIGTMIPGAHSSMVGWALEGYRPGGSLRAWREYFDNAMIYGIDVQPDTQSASEERIMTRICDSTDSRQVRAVMGRDIPGAIDVIIDDPSHVLEDQIATVANFFDYVTDRGLYIIEDIVNQGFFAELDRIKAICKSNPCFFVGPECNMFVITKCAGR